MALFDYEKLETGGNYLTAYFGTEDKNVQIPDGCEILVVFDDVFKGHNEIEQIIFPDTVISIGGFIVDGCNNLKKVKLPSNLEDFWQYAFTRCGLEEIKIPGSVKNINSFTFNECKKLKTVHLNEGTEKICAWAFKDCTSLKDVYIPKSLTNISENAFDGCNNVTIHNI